MKILRIRKMTIRHPHQTVGHVVRSVRTRKSICHQKLWSEIGSNPKVANVARRDVSEFLQLAAEIPIKPEFQEFPLKEANRALTELKTRKIRGAKVLKID